MYLFPDKLETAQYLEATAVRCKFYLSFGCHKHFAVFSFGKRLDLGNF